MALELARGPAVSRTERGTTASEDVMTIRTTLSLAALLAGAALVTACDKSAQSGDGAVSEGSVGTAANTPSGQVVPVGADASKLEAPAVDPAAAAGAKDASAAAPAPQTSSPAPEQKY
jgi:hypothetical protein